VIDPREKVLGTEGGEERGCVKGNNEGMLQIFPYSIMRLLKSSMNFVLLLKKIE